MLETGASMRFYNACIKIKRNYKAEWLALQYRNARRSRRVSTTDMDIDRHVPRKPIHRSLSMSDLRPAINKMTADPKVLAAMQAIGELFVQMLHSFCRFFLHTIYAFSLPFYADDQMEVFDDMDAESQILAQEENRNFGHGAIGELFIRIFYSDFVPFMKFQQIFCWRLNFTYFSPFLCR